MGASLYTDIFELQLCEPETGNAISPFQAYSIAVVLRRALCRSIGIEQDEIGIHTEASRGPKGESARSIFLYDTASGGAGYVTQVAWQLPADDCQDSCPIFYATFSLTSCSSVSDFSGFNQTSLTGSQFR
uniref:DUF1998 domain-containing protein n=1 Tax=Thiolapillus sp. TaxID=2017437 RepID=UPI003AF7C311